MNDEIKLSINGVLFTWDDEKAITNWRKHKISFEAAALAFFDPHSIDSRDLNHDEDEPRRNIIGMTPSIVKLVFVVYVERVNIHNQELVRIISARKANKKEEKIYERNLSR
ncbi:MAG: BrnT family toxin [Synergistaceae bacterium]|nr:BrnT family toxin [Synergistaceae bacterium]